MSDCILWEGPIMSTGYGRVGNRGLAHRVAWEARYGPVPEGLVIHHRCGNKLCFNVEHLECLTHAAHNALHLNASPWYDAVRARTHCPQGHEYTPENTRFKRGHRTCKECGRLYSAAYHKKNRDRLLPIMRERERRRRAERAAG